MWLGENAMVCESFRAKVYFKYLTDVLVASGTEIGSNAYRAVAQYYTREIGRLANSGDLDPGYPPWLCSPEMFWTSDGFRREQEIFSCFSDIKQMLFWTFDEYSTPVYLSTPRMSPIGPANQTPKGRLDPIVIKDWHNAFDARLSASRHETLTATNPFLIGNRNTDPRLVVVHLAFKTPVPEFRWGDL